MTKLIAFLALTILTSCNNAENKAIDLKVQVNKAFSFKKTKLNYYFNKYEIKPSIIINNSEGNQTEVQLLKHKVKWFNTNNETKIKIDGDIFTLKDQATLNIVWNKKDSVDFVNNWDEIKLYKVNGRELVGIRMLFQPCTGLGCSVDYFLIYDLQTKTKNFFGTFKTDNKLALYNFNNDGKIDYLSKTFIGNLEGSKPTNFVYELYSIEGNGKFIQQKNNSGQTYQIKQITFPNDTTKTEKFEQIWFTEINNGR
ncbi:hypothetical protein EON73_03360 [bacterium]|nr:MAG: hypothetical protein EON73_03360 [bacterium]